MVKIAVVVVVLLLAVGFGVLSYLAGSPKDVYGMLRCAVWQMGSGDLQVGDSAPNAELVLLDGATRVRLRDRLGSRPLVLIFGSYT
jgi:hypothetical protein